MKIAINFSPNFSKKIRKFKEIKFVIIHYTGMQSEIESVNKQKRTNISDGKRQKHSLACR